MSLPETEASPSSSYDANPIAAIYRDLSDTDRADQRVSLDKELVCAVVKACNTYECPVSHLLFGVWSAVLYQFTEQMQPVGMIHCGRSRKWAMVRIDHDTPVQQLFQVEEATESENTALSPASCPVRVVVDPETDETNEEPIRSMPEWTPSLELHTSPMGQRFELVYAHRRNHWPARTLATTIETALACILQSPQLCVNQVDYFSPLHRQQLLDWTTEPLPEVLGSFPSAIVQNVATETANASAVEGPDGRLTYGELIELSSTLSAYLQQQCSVGPGTMVAISFEKSIWAIVAMLALNQAGACYVPFDIVQPRSRLAYMVSEGQIRLLLTSQLHLALVDGLTERSLIVSPAFMQGLPPSPPSPRPLAASNPHDPAYCLFTSGSTGKPKGCLVSHASLASASAQLEKLRLTRQSRVLQFASFSFAISLVEIWLALFAGGTVCIVSGEERTNDLGSAMAQLRVSWTCMTATVLDTLRPGQVPSLETVVIGGEPLQKHQIRQWGSSVHLLQEYGLTEWAGVCTVSKRVTSPEARRIVGWPANARCWLTNAQDVARLAPIGAIAELVIEGPCLALGYLNQPERTLAVFVDPPAWRTQFGLCRNGTRGRLYRTGDLVRYNSDGSLSYVGRKDTQVKIRGHRVEVEEVEHHVRQCCPAASKVIVEAVRLRDQRTAPVLVAFLLPSEEISPSPHQADTSSTFLQRTSEAQKLSVQDCRRQLCERVPDYMAPEFFVWLHRLPTTITGKVDRRALRDVMQETTRQDLACLTGQDQAPMIEPRDEKERRFRSLLADALGRDAESVSMAHSFFDIGGDSLVAMKVAAAARSQGLGLMVGDMYQRPQLALLVANAPEFRPETIQPVPFALLPSDIHVPELLAHINTTYSIPKASTVVDVLPISSVQKFFLDQWPFSNLTFSLNGMIDFDRLRRACTMVFRKYEMLRAFFIGYNGVVLQVLLHAIDDTPTPFEHLSETDDVEHTTGSLLQEASAVSPLETVLPTRFTLVSSRLSDHQHTFTIRISHAQYDGLCLPRILEDIQSCYRHESSIPPASPILEFSSVLHYRQRHHTPEALDFWREHLAGVPRTLDLSTRFGTSQAASTIVYHLRENPLMPALPPGITEATVVKAAWAIVLAQFCHRQDLFFGQVVNSRSLPLAGIDEVVGPCLNLLPVRLAIQSQWTVMDLLRYVQQQHVETLQYDYLELPEIVRGSTDWPSDTQFECMLQYQNNVSHQHTLTLDNVTSEVKEEPYFDPRDTLWIICVPEQTSLELRIFARSHVVSSAVATSMLTRLGEVVQQLPQSSTHGISQFLPHICG